MRNVKLVNGLLWVLNGLLGAGIVAFAYFFLLTQGANPLQGFSPEDGTGTIGPVTPPPNDAVLKSLNNPLEPRAHAAAAATLFKATLKGTLPTTDPKRGTAFIKSMGRNVELVADMGEPIQGPDGKLYEEFRGWVMAEVSKDRAVFTNGAQRQVLTLDPTTPAGPPGAAGAVGAGPAGKSNRVGQAYSMESFKSRLLASAESRQVWGMDPDEIDWAIQNTDQIVDREFQVSPFSGGGLKIDSVSSGSIGATRGLMAGDVVRDVNGQPLNNLTDIRTLMNNPAMRQQSGLRITVERAGKPFVLEYRPLPRQ